MESSAIALIIVVLTMISFVTEIVPLPVTAIGSCLAMSLTGVMSFPAAFSGFSNDTLFMVIGAMVMGDSLFETGVAQDLGQAIIRFIGTNEKRFLLTCILMTAFLSAFLSNTAVVAMMLPIVRSIAVSSGGKIQPKNCMIGIGYASVAGGACTLVGSTPQLVAQGILLEYGLEGMGFFDLTWSGVMKVAIIAAYFATIGYRRMNRYLDFADRIPTEEQESQAAAGGNTLKKLISLVIIIFAMVGFIAQIWTVGIVAMVGAMLCIVTGCITFHKVVRRMDWSTVVVLGGSFGFANGINSSGVGILIADSIINLVGRDVSPWIICGAICLLCIIMGNMVSHTATTAAMCPIVIVLSQQLGINPVSAVMCIIMSVCAAYVNPAATPPLTMTLTAGYRFRDFVKIGLPLQLIVTAFVLLTLPLFIKL